MSELPDHVQRNRVAWDAWAQDYGPAGERAWSAHEPNWGIWNIPEAQVGMLPEASMDRT